jgi:hypothetical protein
MKNIPIILIFTLLTTGCAFVKGGKKDVPPSVTTANVVRSLEETKVELNNAGEANTAVAKKIDTALTLAERLEKILEQIESSQPKQ